MAAKDGAGTGSIRSLINGKSEARLRGLDGCLLMSSPGCCPSSLSVSDPRVTLVGWLRAEVSQKLVSESVSISPSELSDSGSDSFSDSSSSSTGVGS